MYNTTYFRTLTPVLYWYLEYTWGYSRLRIYITVTSPYPRDRGLHPHSKANANPTSQLGFSILEGNICRYHGWDSSTRRPCHIPISPLSRLSRTSKKLISTSQRQPVPNKSVIKQHRQDQYNYSHFHPCTNFITNIFITSLFNIIWLHLTNNKILHHASVSFWKEIHIILSQ